jgi:hypothetical protein
VVTIDLVVTLRPITAAIPKRPFKWEH